MMCWGFMETEMARMANRHLNLRRLTDKLWASMSKRWSELYDFIPKDPADVLEQLRKERLQMTDWEFRTRYGRWL